MYILTIRPVPQLLGGGQGDALLKGPYEINFGQCLEGTDS